MKCNYCGTDFNGNLCPGCGAKAEKPKKKPFFLKWWFIILAILIVGVIALSVGNKEDISVIDWNQITLLDKISIYDGARGTINYESSNGLSITIKEVSKNQFAEYKNKCVAFGYAIESEDSSTSYTAFNSEGYQLRLAFFNDELHIYLDAPETFNQLQWPKSGLGAMLPTPNSAQGNISTNNSKNFIVHVGNIPLESYHTYVEACEELGFTEDFSKDIKYYTARNADGYKLTLRYLGFNKIEIALKAPESNTGDSTNNNNNNNTSGIDKTFKDAMDSYEKFIDEYVTFTKKYMNNPTDPSLLASYTNYLTQYANLAKDFEKWEDEELSTDELSYYIEVQARVTKKLLEITK